MLNCTSLALNVSQSIHDQDHAKAVVAFRLHIDWRRRSGQGGAIHPTTGIYACKYKLRRSDAQCVVSLRRQYREGYPFSQTIAFFRSIYHRRLLTLKKILWCISRKCDFKEKGSYIFITNFQLQQHGSPQGRNLFDEE